MDDMIYTGLLAQGYGFYEQLRLVDHISYDGSRAQDSRCYE